MPGVQEAIIANAAYYTRLVTTIGQFEHVPSAKEHQINYIKDTEGQLAAIQKEVAQLAEKTRKERKEHETFRDSARRRFTSRLMGKREKYEAKANKGEKEYVEALEREMVARGNQAAIQKLLDVGRDELENLTIKEEQLLSVKAELTALYGQVFDGPTESFPEDDRLEHDFNVAEKRCNQIQATLDSESQAAEILAKAGKHMAACQNNMQETLGYSRYDMWGGGSVADIMERNALANAQDNATEVEKLVSQAVRASPRVKPIARINNIAHGSLMTDIFIDNIFTDMEFHNKIKQSAAQVALSHQQLMTERDASRHRADAAGAQFEKASKTLDRCRRELEEFRKATFESYLAQNPPPPSYDVITTEMKPAAPSDIANHSPPPPTPPPKISPPTPPPPPDQPGSEGPSSLSVPSSSTHDPQNPVWNSRNPYSAAIAWRQVMSTG